MKEEIYQYNCIICGNNQCIKVYKEAPDLAKKEAQEEVSYCKNCSNLLNNKRRIKVMNNMKEEITHISDKIKKLSKEIIENSEILVYSDNMKSSKELLSLQKYLIKNPEQRFWQGLINWAGFNIYKGVTNKNKTSYEDLFYK